VKRDDLFPEYYGGNKARKIVYILEDAAKRGSNALVTAGSSVSNHARVCALAAARLGWKCAIIVHPDDFGADPALNPNLEIIRLTGASLSTAELSEVPAAMDAQMARLRAEGYNPYYVWGGGHCVQGSLAYYQAVRELKAQVEEQCAAPPNFIVVASGTGSTHAGIHLGCFRFLNGCTVIGVSIARQQARATPIVEQSVRELAAHLDQADPETTAVNVRADFMGRGYRDRVPEVDALIPELLELEGLPLDPVYTGKAFFGLVCMARRGDIAVGSRVVYWHTGGLVNLFSSLPLTTT
jgi:1-aminocyclopropane-1-carboxylate deaminase/D-cysteine desulfhydrase-like pyridoxal-dependent ACC family enzyme